MKIERSSGRLASFVLCCAALLASTALSAMSQSLSPTHKECVLEFMRLPKRLKPIHYKLDFKVDPDRSDFSGQVEIDVQHNSHADDVLCNNLKDWLLAPACNRAKIFLNVDMSLEITDVTYEDLESNSAIAVVSVCHPDTILEGYREMIVIELAHKPGKDSSGKLRLSFNGKVQTDFKALFRADYHDSKANQKKHALLTRFKSGHARKMFPCFDEPEFKATFELSVEHPAHLTAIANTRPLRQEDDLTKKYTRTYFSTTPKMSTYLLAFAVGEFERIETKPMAGVNMTLGIYTPPGRSGEAQTSLAMAAKAYAALHEFFDLDQPLEKIDFVSCKEFPGAMENWGLITMEEFTVLLEQSADYEATNAYYAIKTIIHELSHQWFGNLVSLKWWDDLWLIEGFSSWIANELADQLYPDRDIKQMYLVRDLYSALDLDSQPDHTHSIIKSAKEFKSVAEVEASFDKIAYLKATAVFRMLSEYVGREQFMQGLRAYLKANLFGNVEDPDLWSAISETSGLDVRQLMDSWITQPGFPLITVKLIDNVQRLELSQMRFPSTSESDTIPPLQWKPWPVPITLVVSDGAEKQEKVKFMLDKLRDEIQLPSWFDLGKPGHWLKLNSDFQGFYRVRYETSALLDALRVPIETKAMQPADRLNLIEERLGLLQAGMISEQQLEDLLAWYRNEDHDAVISFIGRALDYIGNGLDLEKRGLYSILINYYEKNGRLSNEPNGASLVKRFVRADTFAQLAFVNYEPVIKEAFELFEKADGVVPAFVRGQVYSVIAKLGSYEQFPKVMELVKKIGLISERDKMSVVFQLREALEDSGWRRVDLNERFPRRKQRQMWL